MRKILLAVAATIMLAGQALAGDVKIGIILDRKSVV